MKRMRLKKKRKEKQHNFLTVVERFERNETIAKLHIQVYSYSYTRTHP